MINEENSLGALTRTYVMDDPAAMVAAILADVSGTNPATGTPRYYTHDNLGSTRALWASNKSGLGSYEYTPYGSTYAATGASIATLGGAFTGKPWDPTAQLYYFPYRYYSPDLARWLTRDPLGMVEGTNTHVYVHENPTASTDALGLLRDCDQEHIDCFNRCWKKKPPRLIERCSAGHYAYCTSKCLAEYMECLAENALEQTLDSLQDALDWLADHPEVVVGTIVVVAGITFVVASGGAGGLVLVPVAAL